MEALLEEVRKYPALYNQRDDRYRHTEYKDRIWQKIAIELKAKGGIEECKKKWTSIRDQLRRTLQKRKTDSGQAAISHRKYKYENQLEFLVPYIIERETLSNISNLEEGNGEEVGTQVTVDEDSLIDEQIQIEEEQPEIQQSQHFSKVKTKKFGRPASLKRKAQPESKCEESPSSQLMAYILAEKEKETLAREKIQIHPVDAFLAGIAPSLKTLNPILLNKVKTQIFSVVQEYELSRLKSSGNQCISDQSPQHEPSQAPTPSAFIPSPYPSPK